MEINCRSFFQDFNPSKFVVYTSVLIFAFLFALRQDGTIQWPYPAIFLPLYAWKLLAIFAGIVGFVVHCKHPPNRNDVHSELEFRGMMLCFTENVLLLMFEILVCFKLETSSTGLWWVFVFIPLLSVSLISIIVCIWSVRREKNFEFELFFAVNILQFVFVAVKLDKLIDWSWVIIFGLLIGVLYACILAVLLLRSLDLLPEHRRQHLFSALGYTFLVVPVLIFLVLLCKKIDGHSDTDYVVVCLPLYISLLCLLFMACGTRGGNNWWFGIRKDFCVWLLDALPWLREYGNVSYRFADVDQIDAADTSVRRIYARTVPEVNRPQDGKPVVPIIHIDMPD